MNGEKNGVNRVRFAALLLAVAAALLAVAPPASVHAAERKKISLDELVIEGNIQKPQAFFILPRTNLNLADLERREDLRSRIFKAVEKDPF